MLVLTAAHSGAVKQSSLFAQKVRDAYLLPRPEKLSSGEYGDLTEYLEAQTSLLIEMEVSMKRCEIERRQSDCPSYDAVIEGQTRETYAKFNADKPKEEVDALYDPVQQRMNTLIMDGEDPAVLMAEIQKMHDETARFVEDVQKIHVERQEKCEREPYRVFLKFYPEA